MGNDMDQKQSMSLLARWQQLHDALRLARQDMEKAEKAAHVAEKELAAAARRYDALSDWLYCEGLLVRRETPDGESFFTYEAQITQDQDVDCIEITWEDRGHV